VWLSLPGVARPAWGYFPDPPGIGVRVGGIWVEGAEVSGAKVVVADQLELALARHVRIRATVVGWLVRSAALPALSSAGLQVDDVFVFGLSRRAVPWRVLAHDYPPMPAVCGGRLGLPARSDRALT